MDIERDLNSKSLKRERERERREKERERERESEENNPIKIFGAELKTRGVIIV